MKAIYRFHEAEERKNKGSCSTSSTNRGKGNVASFVGESLAGKNYVIKMKVLKSDLSNMMHLTQWLIKTMLPSWSQVVGQDIKTEEC